jgi:hypothetical protein
MSVYVLKHSSNCLYIVSNSSKKLCCVSVLLSPFFLLFLFVCRIQELPPVIDEYDGEFECPITFDVEMPVLMVKRGTPILEGIIMINKMYNNEKQNV